MDAIFRICGNESQPGLQILEKLATPMLLVRTLYKTDIPLRWTPSAGFKGVLSYTERDNSSTVFISSFQQAFKEIVFNNLFLRLFCFILLIIVFHFLLIYLSSFPFSFVLCTVV